MSQKRGNMIENIIVGVIVALVLSLELLHGGLKITERTFKIQTKRNYRIKNKV